MSIPTVMYTVLVDPFEGPVNLGMLQTAYEGVTVICPTSTVEEIYRVGRYTQLGVELGYLPHRTDQPAEAGEEAGAFGRSGKAPEIRKGMKRDVHL
jgi:hypothetical protein